MLMIPLAMAQVGEESTIMKINGQDKTRQHLAELGFVVGEKVTVISKLGGNMILSVKNSRIAVDEDMLKRIMV